MDRDADFDIKPDETVMTGFWIDLGSKVTPDAVWERIEWLVAERLELVARAPSGPDALYRDPRDGRLWEKVHHSPHLKGGGPPALAVVSAADARERYGMGRTEGAE